MNRVGIRAFCVWGFAACVASGASPAGARAGEVAGWLEVDATRLNAREIRLLERSVEEIEKLELEPIQTASSAMRAGTEAYRGGDFERLFGGPRGSDVIDYLRERIRYLGKDMDEARNDGGNSGTYASNYGPSWLELLYKRDVLGEARARPTAPPFRRGTIPIDSPRAGLVVLGKVFGERGTSDFDRMETLVHEARHSDCPALPSKRDLEAYMNDRPLEMTDAGRACTNVHMPCPKGHALAGEDACDTHPWGAYMAGYVFAEETFKRCRGCSEAERQQALATAKEDWTRLDPALRQRMREGRLPEPVLESLP